MTVAVLKNRLLDITERQFSEGDYGARSISDLVRQIPGILELDETSQPPIVRFRESEQTDSRRSRPVGRIRRDLWNAIVDYSLGEPYVWTGNQARPGSECGSVEDLLELPTLTVEEESSWREEFAESVLSNLNESEKVTVERWKQEHLSFRILPAPLQRQWNEEFKGRILDRLKAWFIEHGIRIPEDLLVSSVSRKTLDKEPSLHELRALVIRCVERMTAEELSELRLPPQALLRSDR